MSQQGGHVLVVDDNREVLTAIRLMIQDYVESVQMAMDPSALPNLLREQSYDVILLDMNFSQGMSSGQEGFQWLERIRRLDPDAVVIMITAYGDVEKAVRAMKSGATDFVIKPWVNEDLLAKIQAAIKVRKTRREASSAPSIDESPASSTIGAKRTDPSEGMDMIGESPVMMEVFQTIKKVAATDANVLILGEHGTGKELAARSIHNWSPRAGRSFINVDLGALSEQLFESELFGHMKGAFTGAHQDRAGRFEAASSGTIFLDEIGNIPLLLQNKLLTVLERREVTRVGSMNTMPIDVRLVCATNMPIYEMVRSSGVGQSSSATGHPAFRADLLYRINTVEIHLPPLRDRKEDFLPLAHHFLALHSDKYRRPRKELSASAVQKLLAYHWPGNVRELRNTMERAVIMSENTVLEPQDFLLSAPLDYSPEEDDSVPDSLDLEAIERLAIRKALSKYGGNISRAAAELGLTRRSLYRRIEKYGL